MGEASLVCGGMRNEMEYHGLAALRNLKSLKRHSLVAIPPYIRAFDVCP